MLLTAAVAAADKSVSSSKRPAQTRKDADDVEDHASPPPPPPLPLLRYQISSLASSRSPAFGPALPACTRRCLPSNTTVNAAPSTIRPQPVSSGGGGGAGSSGVGGGGLFLKIVDETIGLQK